MRVVYQKPRKQNLNNTQVSWSRNLTQTFQKSFDKADNTPTKSPPVLKISGKIQNNFNKTATNFSELSRNKMPSSSVDAYSAKNNGSELNRSSNLAHAVGDMFHIYNLQAVNK